MRIAFLALVACGPAPYALPDRPTYAEREHCTVGTSEWERADAREIGREMDGHWSGQGRQSDGIEWRIVVDVHSAHRRCASVFYPDVGCGGFWECSETSDGELHGIEHITRGRDRCIDGEFTAQITGDGVLEYHSQAQEIEAFARLSR